MDTVDDVDAGVDEAEVEVNGTEEESIVDAEDEIAEELESDCMLLVEAVERVDEFDAVLLIEPMEAVKTLELERHTESVVVEYEVVQA